MLAKLRYEQSLKGKETKQRIKASPKAKIYDRAYRQTPKGRAIQNISKKKNKLMRRGVEGFHTAQEWLDLKEHYGNVCLCCKKHESELDRPLEQDHVIPIAKGGSN